MLYTVALDAFHGPLDLLLYLVKRNEVDIGNIPITRLADQFLEYLSVLREADVELAGDFLVLAATLIEIKARALLPEDPEQAGEEEADPRRELVRQLLEYRRVKDATVALEQRAEARNLRVARTAPAEPPVPGETLVRPVELWDLVSAFARLVRETQTLGPTSIVVDETPQAVYEQRIRSRVQSEGRVPFRELFDPPYIRIRLIGLFLALLELIRSGEIWLDQPDPFGDIWLSLPPGTVA